MEPSLFTPGVFRENMEVFYPGEYDSMYDTYIALTPSISIDPYLQSTPFIADNVATSN